MKPLPPLEEIDRLLIVKTSSIGDVIHALPAAQAIKQTRPGLKLGWVARERCADILRGNPWIDHLHIVPNKPSLRDLAALSRDLRSAQYQAAMDMQGLFLSGLITWLSGAPARIGWDRNRECNRIWLTNPVVAGRDSDQPGDTHEVDALYGFAKVLGVDAPHSDFPSQHYLAADGAEQAAAWLNAVPPPRVALNVGASREYKRWPTANWAALAESLLARDVSVVFIGDQRDSETVAEVRGRMREASTVIDLSGKTNLRQLASVLVASDLVISGDSGPMHLAVAVGTPVIAIFGATNPARHGPYGSQHHVVQAIAPTAQGLHRPTSEEGAVAMRAVAPDAILPLIDAALMKKCHGS